MRSANSADVNLTALLRIVFRWRREGLFALAVIGALSLLFAVFKPLQYEAQVILERKPSRFSLQPQVVQSGEFDVGRLTSETQRSLALLKSRFLLERWLDALGLAPVKPTKKEKALERLYRSLTIQPINYTDLFILKIKAVKPEEAQRRAKVLVDLFIDWDAQQNRIQSEELSRLLRARLLEVRTHLTQRWAEARRHKSRQSLSLSGSEIEKGLDAEITAQERLYGQITVELEEAERELSDDTLRRIHMLTPPTVSAKPIYSRRLWLLVACVASLLAALGFIFLLEWRNPGIYRAGDVYRVLDAYPVLVIPRCAPTARMTAELKTYLMALLDAMDKQLATQGSVTVQITSSHAGDGKTTFASALAAGLAASQKALIVHRTLASDAQALDIRPDEQAIAHARVGLSTALDRPLEPLKKIYAAILIDTDAVPASLPGSDFLHAADILCVVLRAGVASLDQLKMLKQQLKTLPPKPLFVNHAVDPLPPWLRK